MSTTTQTQSATKQAPELTVFYRVAAIPLVSSSLETINNTLTSNAYTRSPYCTAKDLSVTAYKYTEPLQVRLAPLIVRADGYANKAVDAVESRYPYPFKAKPEEVAGYVRQRRDSVVSVANKAIDEKVKTPAYNVAQGIDQRFAPIVDYFEARLSNSNEAGPSSPPDAKYQYQRALALSRSVKDRVYDYSSEQIKHLQAQSILVQRATETAHSITSLASSSLASAQHRVHTLSDTMLLELQRLQASTQSLPATFSASASDLQSSLKAQIPPQIQETFHEFSASLSTTITDLQGIVTAKDIPLQEKVGRIGAEVRDRVSPLLDSVQKRLLDILGGNKQEGQSNGSACSNSTNGRAKK